MSKMSDIQAISLLPRRKAGAEIVKRIRRALKNRDCGAALYLVNRGSRLMKVGTYTTLKARVDRCYVSGRGGTV